MGTFGWFFWGEEDAALVTEIARIHHFDHALVEEHYKEMIESIRKETENKK